MHGRAFQIRVFTVGQRRSSHVIFSAQASRERGTVVPAACTSPPCGDKPALDAMASQGLVGSVSSGESFVLWKWWALVYNILVWQRPRGRSLLCVQSPQPPPGPPWEARDSDAED